MSQNLTQPNSEAEAADLPPLNPRQKAFGRELGVALARGDRDYAKAYAAAGYAEHRGNAARLAADPRVKAIADVACEEANRLAGLHIGYLQAQSLRLFQTSPAEVYRAIAECLDDDGQLRTDLTDEQKAKLDAATWPLHKLKIGDLAIELADKKSLAEMLAKQLGVGKDESNVSVGVAVGSVRFVVENAPVANEPTPVA